MRTWKIDSIHSDVKFKVKHLLISTVTGKFNSYNAEIKSASNDFTNAEITFEADVNSIDTGNEMRDNHLKSADFFDEENHPKMTFVSKSFDKISDNRYELNGDMTIRGNTKPVKLDVEYNGKATGMDGVEVAGFEITGTLNRFDFGLHWNALTEAGGMAVGKDIKLEIFAEMKEFAEVNAAA
jgi:polyisoprenoid-binding protein YceI